MSEALDLEFRQDVIDVHLAYAHHSLSNPMIVEHASPMTSASSSR